MRITAVLLLILVLWHVSVMHLANDGSELDYAFVARRWSSFFWRGFDFLLLSTALLHGVLGVRTITTDYVRDPRLRRTIQGGLSVIGFSLLVLASAVLFTFKIKG
jgi:succinate dehydrogenase / fumarate reductase membrane anchor subunit